jgi:hypothetical protein
VFIARCGYVSHGDKEEQMARSPYIEIMRAAEGGRGLSLTWEECCALSMDDAIATHAANSLSEAEWDKVFTEKGRGWLAAKRDRTGLKPANLSI